MIVLFTLERAHKLPPDEHQKIINLLALIKRLEKTSIPGVSTVA